MQHLSLHLERNLVKEILRECNILNITVQQPFVEFMVKLYLLDPNWSLTEENMLSSRANVEKFVAFIIDRLRNQTLPGVVGMRIEFYFECSMGRLIAAVELHRQRFMTKLSPLKNQIIKTTPKEAKENLPMLKKRIVSYAILVSGMGNPRENQIYSECHCVLRSVMDNQELIAFTKLKTEEKKTTLHELVGIMSGIRLYNKMCNRGGFGILDLRKLVKEVITELMRNTMAALPRTQYHVNAITELLERLYVVRKDNGCIKINLSQPDDIDIDDIECLKDMLVVYRQHEIFLAKIADKTTAMEKYFQETCQNIDECYEAIIKASPLKIAVAAHLVFPLFIKLSNYWCILQEEVLVISKLNHILIQIGLILRDAVFNRGPLNKVTFEFASESDKDKFEEVAPLTVPSGFEESVTLILPPWTGSHDSDFPPLEYAGFCPYMLVKTNGTLIPGNLRQGVSQINGKYYAFSCQEAHTAFVKNSDRYVKAIVQLCRQKPHLMCFLGMRQPMVEISTINVIDEDKCNVIIASQSTQCEIDHDKVVTPHTDLTYMWNVWDLKRQALQLANLTARLTKSTQTNKTQQSSSIKVQRYQGDKTQKMQTMIDSHTNVPKPSRFIWGLRGDKSNRQFVFDITMPVNK